MSRLFLTKTWAPWLGGIILLTLIGYGAALNNLFVPFDDNTLIYMNPAVAHLSLRNLWFIFTSYDPELYIPLTFLSYIAIHALAGFNPGAYHAASLLLHCTNVVLVAWIVWQMTGKRPVALIAAALFALHPLHSEAVLWAAAMKDMLSSTLGLLAVGWYLRWKETEERRAWIACMIFFFLGLLAKVSIVLLPALFILIDWSTGKVVNRRTILEKWPLYILSIVFAVIALAGKSEAIGGAGLMVNLLLPFKATAFYVQKLAWPTHLSILYPQVSSPTVSQVDIVIPMIIVAALVCAAVLLYRRQRIIAAGIVWYLLMLLPSFSTFQKGGHLYFASDRYAYLPSIGLFLIVAVCAHALWQRYRISRIPLTVVAGAAVVASLFGMHRQVLIWKDSKALFGNVLRLQPAAVIAYNNYATELTDPKEALPYFQKAVEMEPTFILPYRNMAGLFRKTGDRVEEKKIYEMAIPLLMKKNRPSDDDASLLFEYAEFKEEDGDRAGMFETLEQAITLKPDLAEAHYNIGVKYEKYGMMDRAGPALEQAIALGGNKPDFLYHIASVYAQTGRLEDAALQLELLVDINPGYEKAAEHLANIRKMLNR